MLITCWYEKLTRQLYFGNCIQYCEN